MNPIDVDCMWYATSFYDILKDLPKEEVQVIADECGNVAEAFPLPALLDREFKILAIDGSLTGLQIIALLTVCTDILNDNFDKTTGDYGDWLVLSKQISERNN